MHRIAGAVMDWAGSGGGWGGGGDPAGTVDPRLSEHLCPLRCSDK